MTRNDARMIAEELAKLLKPQLKALTKEEENQRIHLSEAARLLGVSPKTLYNDKRGLSTHKIGKKTYFLRGEVMNLINR